ncbi:MAG TPA: inverse autotransporter beta domain-containing protein, partial [Rhizomicrobium sp.]|nr:inverse autotransporter beta domain-containing protein [Rhizomicrobium sp.]
MRAYELRPSVKSSLMIGAAGAAVTFGSATAFGDDAAKPPPSINKYLPYVQVGGTSGDSMSTGGVTMFIPAWQAFNQLLYVKLGGNDSGDDGNFGSIGLGYRQKIAPTWIVGAFGAFDHTHTELGNDFSQFVFGGELLNPNWEFHGNAYIATNLDKIDLIKNSAKVEIDGNDIAIVRETEAPYSGFDGSGGYRVFKTPGTDGRLYAGGFYFKPSDQFDTKAIAGPKAGFEFNVYDLDFLGPQSRLQIQGEGRRDDVRKDSGYIGINLRVPLDIGLGGQGAQVLDELDRRMVDDPQTTGNVLTHPEFNKPEPVVIYGTAGGRTQPTNTIFYVDNTTGRGTYPNPTTFEDATTRGGKNALIVITTEQGDVSGVGNLADGDMVIGAGTTLTIKGSETGYKFTHTFAPGEHDAVLNVSAGHTAITLASNNALYNFAIHGSFDTAIAGDNIGTATIKNVTIQGDGSAGQKGIAFTQDGSTPLDLLMTDSSVSGTGSDGISFTTHLDGAQTLNEKIEFDNVSVSNVGGNGITFSTEASGGANITQNIALNNVSVSGAGDIGIGIAGFAKGEGSQLTQTAMITDANVSDVTGTGIAIYGYTSGGGTLTQTASIDPTTVNNSGYALGIGAYAYGGTLNQTVTVDTLSGSGDNNGVEIYAYAGGGATLNQTAMLSNIGFDAVGHDGVRIFAHSYNGAYINQGVEFDGLTLNGAGLYDLAVEAYADGGRIKQTALFNNLTINGSAQTAVDIFAEAGNGGESFARPHFNGGEGGESGGGEGGYYALI